MNNSMLIRFDPQFMMSAAISSMDFSLISLTLTNQWTTASSSFYWLFDGFCTGIPRQILDFLVYVLHREMSMEDWMLLGRFVPWHSLFQRHFGCFRNLSRMFRFNF